MILATISALFLASAITPGESLVPVPTTFPSSTCFDEITYCFQWAQAGQCASNAAYMNTRCQWSCKLCNGIPPVKCADSVGNCAALALNCGCNANFGYMSVNCMKTCGVCSTTVVAG